jgi:hypothetical protein
VTFAILFWIVSTVATASQSAGQLDWVRADAETVRVPPSAFSDLPDEIQMELEHRGCTIPQPQEAKHVSNVIRGRFTSAAKMDWAVLCSRERISTILVFRAGSTSDVAELASRRDADFLQGTYTGELGFSRKLNVAGPDEIQTHFDAYGGPQPPTLDHDGIDDAFLEKASVIHYWHEGRWLQLQGAD